MTDKAQVAELRAALARVTSERLKAHMLQALDAFEEAAAASDPSPAQHRQQQPESDRTDPVAAALREKRVMVQAARDALFLAVHALLLEAGFRVDGGEADALPSEWEANSATGLFTAAYRHPNDLATKFALQGLFVGNKFEVYISAGEQTHSIELSADAHVASDATLELPALGADLLRDLDALRQQLLPFLQNVAPKKRDEGARGAAVSSPAPPPTPPPMGSGGGGTGDFPFPAPQGFPPVGSGDVLPPGLGGGDPGMLVGPDSALFGNRFDPSRGPVPGARFDPFGPPIDPLQMPGRGGLHPGPPNLPFGTPNPDHLRMPRDFDDDMGFGFGRPPPGRGGGGGGGFGGGSQPFGSGHSFF